MWKRNQKTEKGRGIPFPFDSKVETNFPVCTKFAVSARQIENKKISSV